MQLSQQEIEKMLAGLMEGSDTGTKVQKVKYSKLEPGRQVASKELPMEFLANIRLLLEAQLAETTLSLRQVLALNEGDILSLDKLAGEPAEIYLNQRLCARGEIVVINEVFGIRIHNLLPPEAGHDS